MTIVFGYVDKKHIKNVDSLLFSDSIISVYFGLSEPYRYDLTCIRDKDNLLTVLADNNLFNEVWSLLIVDKFGQNESLKFLLGYSIVEICKIICYLQDHETETQFVLSKNNCVVLKKILNNFFPSRKFGFRIVKNSFYGELRFLLYHRRFSFYGRYSYLKYFLGFPFKLSSFRQNPVLFDTNAFYVSPNLYNLDAEVWEEVIPEKKIADLNVFEMVSTTKFIRLYFSFITKSQISFSAEENKHFFKSQVLLWFLFKYFGAPFLEYYRIEMLSKVKLLNSKSGVLQMSDVSPHRFIISKSFQSASLASLVSQHGEITEPMVISDIASERCVLFTESTYRIYQSANPCKRVELLSNNNGSIQQSIFNLSRDVVINKLHVFTCSFSGMSYDLTCSFNIKMIAFALDYVKKNNPSVQVVVKLHPSESLGVYKGYFPSLLFSKDRLEDLLGGIEMAICGPSTVLSTLKNSSIPVLYYSEGLQPRFGFPENCLSNKFYQSYK